MRGSGTIRIGEVRGIALNVHLSLLFLLAYLVFLIVARFRLVAIEAGINPLDLALGPVAWGFLLAFALFASVLLHELGHALTAQAQGVRVRHITLMMLGGVSSIDQMPERHSSEFKLAIVGPAVSLALAAALLLIYTYALGRAPNLSFFAYWLGSANLALGIFNLLPAFPLDGGRALRSLLATRQGLIRATQTAVKISKGFAWALGILGLFSFNLLLMVIAFFIYTSAQAELSFLLTRGILKGMRAGEVTIQVEPVPETIPIRQAAELMLTNHQLVLPVMTESGDPAVITLQQIRRVPRRYWDVVPITKVMEATPRFVGVEDSISDALADLARAPMTTLPVRDGHRITGLLRYQDLTDILQLRSLDENPIEHDQDSDQDLPKAA